ncbi:hypothetical protein [Dysgonomonas macrotermitis]|uniref:Uncharacterized protein n=1 Tax=Dysgonomonas macrotermitis TaxID=1346286 RepID=A0A1M5EME6_9BACT|nr:hypothetical protein [Dysgonomonas macrotermitis]SHF80324.1 hypothetical protein SAMN05444362_11079 [Dysgonomonas macrotermitis]
MRHLYYIFIFLLVINTSLYGQIGINTEQISNNLILHIDPKANNDTSGSLTSGITDDDIVVSKDGKVGIGTITPQAKFHLESLTTGSILRIDDGAQQVNRILYSDNTGKGLWKDYTPIAILGQFSTVNTSIPHTTSSIFVNTGITLDLPPGRWLVLVTIIFDVVSTGTTERAWFKSTFADSSTLGTLSSTSDIEDYSTSTTEKRYFSGLAWAGGVGNLVANLTIKNDSNTTKQYNLLLGKLDYAGSIPLTINIGMSNNFSNITAFRIK